MSNINPYAPPSAPADAEVTSVPYQVDGPYLIVRSGVRLPMRCVVTNQPATPEDFVRRQLVWTPSFRLVVARHRCNLEYCINANRRHQIFIWSRLVPIFLALLALAVSMVLGSGIVLLLTLGILQVLRRFVPGDPLRVKRAQGKRFWIEGICPEFLAACVGDFRQRPAGDFSD